MAKLRQGRRVPQHIYLQVGEFSADTDPPLFTVPSAELAEMIVAAVNHMLRTAPPVQVTWDKACDQLVVLG